LVEYQTILLSVLQKGKTTFRKLQKATNISPKTLKQRLKLLVRRKLVKEEGRKSWKRGKKLEYSLTEKGRQEWFNVAFQDVNKNLELINTIVSQMLSKPQELAARREEARHIVHTTAAGAEVLPLEEAAERLEELFKKDKNSVLEEKIQQIMKIKDAYFGPFRKALRNMHSIAFKLAPQATSRTLVGGVYILVTEKGVINAVSEDEILRHPDISVISM
jgi:DNA-binding HxlR family transcriptional regulator